MKGKNQKLKILYLAKIMQEQTDDLDALDSFGIEILKYQEGFRTYYYCGNRDFEIAERLASQYK